MKRIISNEDREKVSKRNQLLVGLILILLMLFSTVGFAFSSGISENTIEEEEYGGVKFLRDASTGYWVFEVNGQEFYTVYNPEEVKDIELINYKTIQNYANKPLYFVGGAGDGFAELYRALSGYVLRVGGACLDEECGEDYPIKNCEADNVIIVEDIIQGNNTNSEDINEEIVTEVNCVYIRARPENQVKYFDAYLFDLLGIK